MSARCARVPHHVLEDPGIGEVAEEHDTAVLDWEHRSKQELYRRVIDAAPVPEISGTSAEVAEQVLAGLASRLANEPVASLALLRSMLTNPEAASAASVGIARYQAQIAQAIPADDASLRAAIISAVTIGITVSRHLVKSDELATADPAQIVQLLRPCVLSLAACPDQNGPP